MSTIKAHFQGFHKPYNEEQLVTRHLNLGRYLVKVTFWPSFLQAKRKSLLDAFDHLAKKNIWFTFERQNACDIVPIKDVLRFYIKVGSRTANETFDISCWIIFGFIVPFSFHVPMNLPTESRIISSTIITRHVSGFHFFLLLLFWVEFSFTMHINSCLPVKCKNTIFIWISLWTIDLSLLSALDGKQKK